VAERVRWILLWTDLRSLLIFLGFWRLGKVAERVRWILSWTELFPCHFTYSFRYSYVLICIFIRIDTGKKTSTKIQRTGNLKFVFTTQFNNSAQRKPLHKMFYHCPKNTKNRTQFKNYASYLQIICLHFTTV